MRNLHRHRTATICAYLAGAMLCAFASAASPHVYSIPDADLRDSVQFALQAAPYFHDGRIQVSVEYGVVHLHGLVFSDRDLRDAMLIAGKAAGDRRVVNNLTIKR